MNSLSFLTRWMWLPLLLNYTLVYGFQRGFSTVLKLQQDQLVLLSLAFSIHFLLTGLVEPFLGYLTDRFKIRNLMIFVTFLGSFSLFLAPHNILLGFGIGWAITSAFCKSLTVSSPMKTFDKNEIYHIAAISSGKNIGAALWLMFSLGAIVKGISWNQIFYFCGIVFFIFGWVSVFSVKEVPNYRLKWSELIIALKDYKLLLYCLAFGFFLVIPIYGFFMTIVPTLIDKGFSKEIAITLTILHFWTATLLRLPWAAAGLKFGYRNVLIFSWVTAIITLILVNHPIPRLIIATISFSSMSPNFIAYAKQLFGKERIATSLGCLHLFTYLGTSIIPYLTFVKF